MARESAAQKKAREAEEAQQEAALAVAGDPVPAQAAGAAPAGLDLSKFINPETAQALDAAPVAIPEAAPNTAAIAAPAAKAEPVASTVSEAENADGSYVVIVDSIGLGPAQYAARGETLLLDASRAQRLLSLKAVRPA